VRSARLDGDRSRRVVVVVVRRRVLSSSAVDFDDDDDPDDDEDADALRICDDRRRGFRCESSKKRTTLVRDADDDGPFDDDDAVDEDAMRSVDIIDIIADGWTSPLSHDGRRTPTRDSH
jgi:hypothetical protein